MLLEGNDNPNSPVLYVCYVLWTNQAPIPLDLQLASYYLDGITVWYLALINKLIPMPIVFDLVH